MNVFMRPHLSVHNTFEVLLIEFSARFVGCVIFHFINGVHAASVIVITHPDMRSTTYADTRTHKDEWPLNFTLFSWLCACVCARAVRMYIQFRNNYAFREEDF